jgi:RNA polymerase sigma-70 factor (ECF subfamily)
MTEIMTERDLVTAAMAGDAIALERLLCTHLPALERYVEPRIPAEIRRQLGTEDILQEILARAFRDINRFEYRSDTGFLAWLKVIADHRLADAIKRLRRKKRGGDHKQLSKANIARLSTSATLIDLLCQDTHLPDDSAARREAEQAIQIALAGLADDQRDAITAHLLQGKPITAVAREMGRTEDAVRGLIHRGKKNLLEAMGRSSRWFSNR